MEKKIHFHAPGIDVNAVLKVEKYGRYDWTANVYQDNELIFEGDRLFYSPEDAAYEIELDFIHYLSEGVDNA